MTRTEYEESLRKLGKETLISLLLDNWDSSDKMIEYFKKRRRNVD